MYFIQYSFFSVYCSFPEYLVLNFILIFVLYLEFVFTSVRRKSAYAVMYEQNGTVNLLHFSDIISKRLSSKSV